VLALAQPAAAAQVAAPQLVQPHHNVDPAPLPQGDVEPAAEVAVGQEHVAGLEEVGQRA
jgi:hypothetical protein